MNEIKIPLLATSLLCGLATSAIARPPHREPYVGMGHSSAFRNNPIRPTGDTDNIAVVLTSRVPITNYISARATGLIGQYSQIAVLSATGDVGLTKNIDGHIGVGMMWNRTTNNNVIGDTTSPILQIGAEGYVGDYSTVGVAVFVAPWGYGGESAAASVQTWIGIRWPRKDNKREVP